MASFAEFLAFPARKPIILAEATPLYSLYGWTSSAPTFPNTYQIALSRLTQTARVTGGVYRRCVAVEENGVALTSRASAALVDANPGSWFWDEAAGVLYVRTTGGGSPDTYTAYAAQVTFYLASTGIVLNRVDGDATTGIYYWPWLTDVPRTVSEVEDVLTGVKLQALGNVSFTNGHGFWNAIVATDGLYTWKNKRIRFYLGGQYNGLTLLRSQYVQIADMLVEDVAADEYTCAFILKELSRQTGITVPITPIFATTYPNLGEGVRGTRKWIGYGRATIKPDLTDTSGNGVYTIADASVQTLFAVSSVTAINKATRARTVLTLTTHYTVDLTLCTLTIVSATYRWQDYEIEVDVTGKPDGAGGYLQTAADIIKDLLQTLLGVTAAEVDTAAFAQAALDAPEEISMWLKDARSLASVLSTSEPGQPSLERSVNGTLQQTNAGVWTFSIWDPGYSTSTATSLRKEDFAGFRPEPRLETIFGTTRVFYNFDHSQAQWTIEQTPDTKTQYLTDTNEALDVYTFLRSASDAQRLAQRYQLFSGAVSTEIEFVERGALLAQARAGDKVLLTFSPAPAAAEEYDETPFEIIRLEKEYSPTITVKGRFGDLKGVGARIGRWMDTTAPDWATATVAERAVSGFWADSSGRIDPADPATLNQSLWY